MIARAMRWSWLTLALLAAPAWAQPREVVSEPAAREQLHVTAYRTGHRGTAFVREVREVDIPAGEVRIALRGVPNTVEPASVIMRVIDGPALEVLEQTYSFDVMTPGALLRAAEGSRITVDVAGVHDGKLRAVEADVVASEQGGVVRTRDGFTFGLDGERQRFSRIPARMTPSPTLSWSGKSATGGKRRLEVSYLMGGLRWSADYVASLSRDGKRLDLSGWVTLQNDTEVTLERVNLAVAAGTVNRVAPGATVTLEEIAIGAAYGDRNEAERESLGDLHLYKIPERTDLVARSIKNVRLLSLRGIPVARRWRTSFFLNPHQGLQTQSNQPSMELEALNVEKSNAGVPIPEGTVRVMVPDGKGTPHLVASSSVVDTPAGEKLIIDMGPVQGMRARLVPRDQRSSLLGSKKITYTLELRNGSAHAGTMRIDLRGNAETKIEIQGTAVERPDATLWRVEVPLAPGATKSFPVEATFERSSRSSR